MISHLETKVDVDGHENGQLEGFAFEEFIMFFGNQKINYVDYLNIQLAWTFLPRIY